jgi:hypothetical protein
MQAVAVKPWDCLSSATFVTAHLFVEHIIGVKKSTAAKASVCERMKSRQAIPFPRSGAGGRPWRF